MVNLFKNDLDILIYLYTGRNGNLQFCVLQGRLCLDSYLLFRMILGCIECGFAKPTM